MRLEEAEARRRLGARRVVRLATADAAGRPHLVVVTFALDGDRLFTAVDQKPKSTRDLKRLRNIHENPAVAALADHYDEDWTRLWWVRADGTAHILTDPAEMAPPLALLQERYAQYRADPPDGPVIAVEIARWT
ncbi:MAG: TIGR03668 family PPOX class F420-dependent oxidoreductase, partial [Streptosporangiales bacterium]|nr:TIGR03668 family PPOX class F420-dependent oxidoreductase [Streptosporangiales bacterium]